MIIGTQHATLLYKLDNDSYCYFYPSTDSTYEQLYFLNKSDLHFKVGYDKGHQTYNIQFSDKEAIVGYLGTYVVLF